MSSLECKLIIFDLDGTLLDTGKVVSMCIASTLRKMGFKVPDEETCETVVGPPLKKIGMALVINIIYGSAIG